MKNFIYICFIFILFSSCLPQRPLPAKRKINRMKDKIENIARYHGFDSVWFERRKVSLDIPEIRRKIDLDFKINRIVETDLLIRVICEENIPKKERQKIVNEILTENIKYEDDSIKLEIFINPKGYTVDYLIKMRTHTTEVSVPTMNINSGLKYYQQFGYWITVVIFIIIMSLTIYILVIRK